jgi:hypothetical protein
MRERPTPRFRPGLEPLEAKQPLAAGAAAAHLAHLPAGHGGTVRAEAKNPHFGFLVFRITNPSGAPNILAPPFGHVLVQGTQPVPGQVYNILQVAVKNETNQTFDASSGFQVKLSEQPTFRPILTGNEQWKPGQFFIFYVLTKKYYPLRNKVSSGFQFKLAGPVSVAIPGPSGIFLRIKYDPATINKILDFAVTRGPGAEGGAGLTTGIADTAIYGFVSANEKRSDFGGYF